MTESETFYVKHKRYNPLDPRLGRHVCHDSRSRNYQVQAQDISALKSIRHQRSIPTLSQGSLGSCTRNASVGALGSGFFWDTAGKTLLSPTDAVKDEDYSVGVYSEATALDPYPGVYPPTDTGSDGLTVAKVLLQRGLISGYQHAMTLEAVLTALADRPVIIGTKWLQDMMKPSPAGKLTITGLELGGHEYVLDELDVQRRIVWMHNSWGPTWGVQGRAYLTWDDLWTLLSDDGDCTVFTPISLPAPQPTPDPVADPKAKFLTSADAWAAKKHIKDNKRFQNDIEAFLAWYR